MIEPDRRHHPRKSVFILVGIDAGSRLNRVAVSREASEHGLSLGSPHKFDVGESLRLTLNAVGAPPAVVDGRVVRIERNDAAESFLWRYKLAVRFEGQDSPAVLGVIQAAAGTAAQLS